MKGRVSQDCEISMKTLHLTLFRNIFKTDRTLGKLFAQGEFFCHTLEDASRPVKIKGETCFETGVYEVEVTRSPRFKRLMPLIKNVPRYIGIRFHGGNDPDDTDGCPLVANNTDGDKIWGTAEAELTEMILKYDRCILTVVNDIEGVTK